MYTIDITKMNSVMQEKRWCAADIIALTGLRGETVRNCMKGKTSRIALDTAAKIAKSLDIPIQELIVEV